MGHPTLDRRSTNIITVFAILTIVILIFYNITINFEYYITKEIEISENSKY